MATKKHFYSHLIETESITIRLNEMGMTEGEKMHLITLMESSLHHVVLDAILSELSEEDKRLFLKEVASNDEDVIWEFLKKRVDNIEDKIVKTAEELKKELHEDINEVGKKK